MNDPTDPNQQLTVHSSITGLVLDPEFRVNGSESAPPWNYPEEMLVNWLREVPIEIIEELLLDGSKGVVWGWAKQDQALRGLLIRFAGVGRDHLLKNWGSEYQIVEPKELLARDLVAYEWTKAMGGEDMVPPLCLRELDTVVLLSNTVRDLLAKQLKISPHDTDAKLGVAATVQFMPREFINFAEYWSGLGINNEERWERASAQLRFSLYRAYFMDFVLGVADRPISALMYNVNTDRVGLVDWSVTFPHIGFSAEKYKQQRVRGWAGLPGVDNYPTTNDFKWLFEALTDDHLGEAVLVAHQLVDRITDDLADQLLLIGIEHDITMPLLAGALLRLSYVGLAPGSVLKRPSEFVRNLCVPVRSGMPITAPKIATAIEYVNGIVGSATGELFDLLEVIMEPAPSDVEFLI